MTRKRNQIRREKRRARNRAKGEKLLALPTGGGPFADRAKLAFQTRKGDAVNELLEFEFGETPIPIDEGDLTLSAESKEDKENLQVLHHLSQSDTGELN